MHILPAVDILKGEVVQLKGGDETDVLWRGRDPVAVAREWEDRGAEQLHVVDLTAALHGTRDPMVAKVLDAVDVPVEVGGGVRSVGDAEDLLEAGADRVIVGTAAWKDPELLPKMTSALPGHIMVALETRGGHLTVKGWKETLATTVDEALDRVRDGKAWGVLHTCVDVEGSLGGVSEELRRVVGGLERPVLASGGVGNLDDVRAAAAAGAWGLVIGSALYLERFALGEAQEAAR